MDAPAHDPTEDPADDVSPEEAWWVCARCDTRVARVADGISLPGCGPVQTHVNPHGVVFLVRTVARMELAVSGPMYPAFSWFPGYAWRVGTCRGCGEHLGWAYIRIVGEGLAQFGGLIDTRLRVA